MLPVRGKMRYKIRAKGKNKAGLFPSFGVKTEAQKAQLWGVGSPPAGC